MLPDLTDIHFSQKMKAIDALRSVMDPEIGLNIIDLGLVYDIDISSCTIKVVMTLSTPNCPMGESIRNGVVNALEKEFPEYTAETELVWEPEWNFERISEEGKIQLGIE